uniref:Uncharacterized protein n=1 Tax=Pan troglodytes TaxID=9598 RepID=A0A2I3RY77_PANTR
MKAGGGMAGSVSGHSESLASLSRSPQTKAGQKLQNENYPVCVLYIFTTKFNKQKPLLNQVILSSVKRNSSHSHILANAL